MRIKKIAAAIAATIALGGVCASQASAAVLQHVILISVDGLHESDLEWYVQQNPGSAMAALVNNGILYSNASTPFPSDSFPGMVGMVTGGTPASTGIYYDDAYSRTLLPAGTKTCVGVAPGAEVQYAENVDKDLTKLDAGQGIANLYSQPLASGYLGVADLNADKPNSHPIFQLSAQARDNIDPSQLPVDPATCKPVYPHQYLKVNTLFEVAKSYGLHTAWIDKHAAYEILNGPSGAGIDDLFAPEINSNVSTDPNAADFTKSNVDTQRYDAFKVQALLNQIAGHDHAGNGNPGVPVLMGMNFQAVSTAQKLPSSYTPESRHEKLLGGYTHNGSVPGPVLESALNFVDDGLSQIIAAADKTNTVLILSAKHGQSPTDLGLLTIIDDGAMIDALNAAWKAAYPQATPALVAHAMDDDGILLWLNDRSKTATDFAKNFLLGYAGNGIGSDPAGNKTAQPFTAAGLIKIYAGADAAAFLNITAANDERVPDIIGVADRGTVYAGAKLSKIAEHGGNNADDRHVPIVVAGVGVTAQPGKVVKKAVGTQQIAPSILRLFGVDPNVLNAVKIEKTAPLPDLN